MITDETIKGRELRKKDVKSEKRWVENKIGEEVRTGSESGLTGTFTAGFCNEACLTIVPACVEGVGAQ